MITANRLLSSQSKNRQYAQANGKDHSQGKFIVLMTSKTSSKTLKPKEVGQMLKTDDFGSKV